MHAYKIIIQKSITLKLLFALIVVHLLIPQTPVTMYCFMRKCSKMYNPAYMVKAQKMREIIMITCLMVDGGSTTSDIKEL